MEINEKRAVTRKHWAREEDEILANLLIPLINKGHTVSDAVIITQGQLAHRTPAACQYRWNRVLSKKKKYRDQINYLNYDLQEEEGVRQEDTVSPEPDFDELVEGILEMKETYDALKEAYELLQIQHNQLLTEYTEVKQENDIFMKALAKIKEV